MDGLFVTTNLSSPLPLFWESRSMCQSNHCSYDEVRLVALCLRGDDTSWETMFDLYHPKLVSIIKALMRGENGTDQAEEIAAAVWSSLCNKAFARLRRYDPETGRLLNFLAAQARREIWRNRRSQRCRHLRERSVARKEAAWEQIDRRIDFSEFLTTLTGRELEFCLSELLSSPDHTVQPRLSVANGWKLRSRVLKKFRNYYLENSSAS